MEKQVVVVGEPAPGLVSRWAECLFCDNSICVYQPDTPEGMTESERVIENDYGWFFVDGAWLCPVCQ
jgi:hypothetical protein